MGFIKHLSDNNQHNILHFYSTFIENTGIYFYFLWISIHDVSDLKEKAILLKILLFDLILVLS